MRLRCVTSNLCVYVCVHACVAMAIISSGVHPPRIDNRGEGSQNNNITDLRPQSINLLVQSVILLFQNCSTPHHSCSYPTSSVYTVRGSRNTWLTGQVWLVVQLVTIGRGWGSQHTMILFFIMSN